MTIAENKRLMQQIFRELAKCNSEPFRDAMADDFCWTVIGSMDWSGTYAGKQAVLSELTEYCDTQLIASALTPPGDGS
jgi:ketosteroid isomerase-like protein